MKRIYAIACAIASGTLCAEIAHPSARICAAITIVTFAFALARRRYVVTAALVIGFALAGLRIAALDHAALARGGAHNTDALLEGRVLDDPALVRGSLRFTLGVSRAEIDGKPLRVRERALVSIRPPPSRKPVNGDVIRVDARLHGRTFPGMDAPARRAARSLIYAGIAVRAAVQPDGIEVTGHAHDPITRVADIGRRAVSRAASHVPRRDRGLLLGVTIGDTSDVGQGVIDDFRTTGLSHVVAVSGANVAFVLALVAFALRRLRAGRRLTIVAMGAALVAFMAITRFEPSVMRAGAMTGISLAALAIGARRQATIALGVSTILLQVMDPFVIHAIGFQLSALATLGLLELSPRIAGLLPPGKLASAAAVTLGAQLAVAPVLVVQFHQLSIISVAANLLVVPAVAPATISGMAAAISGAAWAPLGRISWLAVAPIEWMRDIAHALAQLPLASIATPSGIAGGLLAIAFMVLAFKAVRAQRKPRMFPIVLSVLVIATGGVWARALAPPPLHGLVVTMLDVGQGDAFVVRAGGRVMMIDGGPDAVVTQRRLRALHITRVDLLVMTHPHADHIDGLAPVIETLSVGRALDPATNSAITSYADYERALRERSIPRDRAVAGMSYSFGEARIDVLWPPRERMADTPADLNNNSVVLRVVYGVNAVLFAGEVQEEAQQELLAHPDALRADVVKIAHHGSRHMLAEFYAATHARLALIPVGLNRFGHPSPETLTALRGMRVLRSDRNGEVSVGLDGRGGVTDREVRAAA